MRERDRSRSARIPVNEGTTQIMTPTLLPVSSIGLLHASCLAEILEQVYQTLLPAPLERVIPVKQRLPRLDLKHQLKSPSNGRSKCPPSRNGPFSNSAPDRTGTIIHREG